MKMPPQRYLDRINAALAELQDGPPITRAIGAYCVGLSALVWERTGKVPSRKLIRQLAGCGRIAEGVLLIESSIAKATRAKGTASQSQKKKKDSGGE